MTESGHPPQPDATPPRPRELPPLILHPFSDKRGPETLLECSRAQLILAGVLPTNGRSNEELRQRVLEGRMCEVKMLYYVGLDLNRWLDQCVEVAMRLRDPQQPGLTVGSFATLLVADSPQRVRDKLQRWGVADYKALFSRAIGLNAAFACVPEKGLTQPGFVLDYHRYADALFRCWNECNEGRHAAPEEFTFELYASGEYARILESQWDHEADSDA